jgi:hypothetical protein
MSATPYTNDPMVLIKILNLLKEEGEEIEEDFDIFKTNYLNDEYKFTKEGKDKYLNEITGYISYLNREKDIRYFSYPVFHEISTFISKKNNLELEKRLGDLKNPNTNIDLYIFGKIKNEIKEAVELYSVKELYIDNNKIERLREVISEEYLNFKIIPIKSLENGDSAALFIKDYNGIMAIKYY